MFSLDVVDTDKFLDMPATSQNLYFHLGMRADDDGFIDSPKKITKLVNCGADDLNVLISRGYILPVDDGVVVVRHWRRNNYIRGDRYKPTIYQKEMRLLTENNGIYDNCIQEVSEMDTIGIPMVAEMETQVRLDKNIYICAPKANDSEEKLRHNFQLLYDLYPKKKGRTKAFAEYRLWVSEKGKDVCGTKYRLTNQQVAKAIKKYIAEQEEDGQGDYKYWKNFDTLMGRQLLDYVEWDEEE